MNRFVYGVLSILLFAVTSVIYSQPQAAYIIPDIGAPGMNVYVEFVAPHNLSGTFGPDGVYLNNSNDRVRVEPKNASDRAKVKIGPVIVSWDGRLISTHVFINPELKPNSPDALLVRPEFRIPLVVIVNGTTGNEQTFYIVQSRPFFDGTKNPSELTFGSGMLGNRSPRGALIFDSLKLASDKYTVSTSDCDPNTSGNQGYLPFTLLVRGNVEGTGNTVISVDAVGINGGPGGGGGGGRFYDGPNSSNGDNGGDGYVGGGAGGRNNAGLPFMTNVFRNQGQGSGTNGNSLSGVLFPKNEAYESSGGGTGHPFGSSGISCNNANNCNPPGEFGGGSGINQVRQGGAGGYATEGDGFSGGGKIHGNIMNVPFAGGSGGASGNPQGLDCYAGNGGGGGGAINLFAYNISNLSVSAKGANGGNFSGTHINLDRTPEPFGGSGSGGMVNLLSKEAIQGVSVDVAGGKVNNRSGGTGRVRVDYNWTMNDVNILNSNASQYYGLRTDTTQYVGNGKNYKVRFNQHKPGKNITSHIIYAPYGKDWKDLQLTLTDPQGSDFFWALLDQTEKYHCFVVMQEVPNPNDGDYVREPFMVMSQAAANLLILELNPILVADSVASNPAITCIGFERFIETTIKNDENAASDLEITLSNNNWIFGNNGFEIVEPLGNVKIKPGDSIVLKVKFAWIDGDKKNLSNKLYFNHNDPTKKDPWIITYTVGDAYLPGMRLEGNFDFGDVRVNGKSQRTFDLVNLGEAPLLIENINNINPPFFVISTMPALPYVLNPGQSLKILVEFRPTQEIEYNAALSVISIVTDTTCSAFSFEPVKGKGVTSSIDVNTTEIDFGIIPWCDEKQEVISIKNPASASTSFTLTTLAEIVGENPEAFVITNPKNPPITITPGDGTQFNIKINGKTAGTGVKRAIFRIETDVPEIPIIEVVLKAEIIGFDVVATPNPINLGNVDAGYDYILPINLRNNGKALQVIKEAVSSSPTQLIIPDVSGTIINPGGVFLFNATLKTNQKPANNSITVVFDSPCPDTIAIPVILNYVNAQITAKAGTQQLLENQVKIDTLDFGKFSPCEIGSIKQIEVINNSAGRFTILDEEIINSSVTCFSSNGTGLDYPDTLLTNTTKNGFQIYFDPTGLSDGVYFADYLITVYINGQTEIRKVVLRAEIIEGKFSANPTNIDINEVVGLTKDGSFEIKNDGPYELEIISVSGFNHTAFKLNSNINGIIINPNGTLTVDISFSPDAVITINDSLIIRVKSGNCENDLVIYLNGTGTPSKKLHIYIPDLVVEPTLNNFRIPIYGKLEKIGDDLEGFEIESLKITMLRTVFYPEAIIGGSLLSSNLIGDNREITININDISINQNDSLIAEIEGATLLGETDFSEIKISDVTYSMKTLVGELTTQNGSLKTEICEEGGQRLLTVQGSGNTIRVNPNPSNELSNIIVTPIEKGNYQLQLVDLLGNILAEKAWRNEDNKELSLNFEENLAPGIYTLILNSPTEVVSQQIIIVK